MSSKSRRILIIVGILVIVAGILYLHGNFIICYINSYISPDHPCYCQTNAEKNKVAIIIVKDGIYDTDAMANQILEYYTSVRKDLNIENADIKKFDGRTIDQLDKFIDSLYLNDDVAYVILLGDDLPVANVTYDDSTNLHAMYRKLECVNRDCGCCSCSDIAISLILPPLIYPNDKKTDFVLSILKTYTSYHNDFDLISKKYQKSVLNLVDYQGYAGKEYLGLTDPKKKLGYNLPQIYVFNTEYQKVADRMKKKHIAMHIGVHGDERTLRAMAMSIIGKEKLSSYGSEFLSASHTQPYWTELEEYLEFAKENGAPALFIEASACGSWGIKAAPGDNRYCCWPQTFMESGVWVYYVPGGTNTEMFQMRKSFSDQQTIGLAVRKYLTQQNLIYGDILAHMK